MCVLKSQVISYHIEDKHAVEDVYIRVLAARPSWSDLFLDVTFWKFWNVHDTTVPSKGQWIGSKSLNCHALRLSLVTCHLPCHAFCHLTLAILMHFVSWEIWRRRHPQQTCFAERLSALGAFSAREELSKIAGDF